MPNDENTIIAEQATEQSIQELGGIPTIELSLEVAGMTAYPVDRSLTIADMAADAKATGDAISDVQEAILGEDERITTIEGWTGENIPLNSEQGSSTIAQAFNSIISVSYPVGSIYMTISDNAPTFTGTWVEIAITASWTQLKEGKRGYEQLASGATGGPVHFWLRTA